MILAIFARSLGQRRRKWSLQIRRERRRTPIALVSLLLLVGCISGQQPELLSPLDIRAALIGRLVAVTAPGSDGYYLIRFERGDRAELISETAEYARWYADAERGLCIQKYAAPESCAPLFVINFAHFRWGDATLSDLTIRDRGFGFGFDHDFDGQFGIR